MPGPLEQGIGDNSPKPPEIPPRLKQEIMAPRDLSKDEEATAKTYGISLSSTASDSISLAYWDFQQFIISGIRDMRPTSTDGMPAIVFRAFSDAVNQWETYLLKFPPPDLQAKSPANESALKGYIIFRNPEDIKIFILIILSGKCSNLNCGKLEKCASVFDYDNYPAFAKSTYSDWSKLRAKNAKLESDLKNSLSRIEQQEKMIKQSDEKSRQSLADQSVFSSSTDEPKANDVKREWLPLICALIVLVVFAIILLLVAEHFIKLK